MAVKNLRLNYNDLTKLRVFTKKDVVCQTEPCWCWVVSAKLVSSILTCSPPTHPKTPSPHTSKKKKIANSAFLSQKLRKKCINFEEEKIAAKVCQFANIPSMLCKRAFFWRMYYVSVFLSKIGCMLSLHETKPTFCLPHDEGLVGHLVAPLLHRLNSLFNNGGLRDSPDWRGHKGGCFGESEPVRYRGAHIGVAYHCMRSCRVSRVGDDGASNRGNGSCQESKELEHVCT